MTTNRDRAFFLFLILGSTGCQPVVAGSSLKRVVASGVMHLGRLPRWTGWQPVLPREELRLLCLGDNSLSTTHETKTFRFHLRIRFRNFRANRVAEFGDRKASVHVRGHDGAEAVERAGAVAGWQMGRVRSARRRS